MRSTSAVYNVDALMNKAYNDVVNGTFDGSVVEVGMVDGAVELTPFGAAVPQELQDELNAVIASILAGELEIVADGSVR